MIRSNKDRLFVFGDNLARKGFGGQAKECRGEPNTIGIPTKHRPSNDESAFFTDADYEIVAPHIRAAFTEINLRLMANGTVVYPEAGVGTGLADLQNRAPEIWRHLKGCELAMEIAAGEHQYTCPACGMTTWHPDDVKHHYCGNCHKTAEELGF